MTHVDPWNVTGHIDYNKLIENFGTNPISEDVLTRIKTLTDHEPHIWLKRGIFFSHRDLTKILNAYEKKQKFYIYT